jgi:heptosyltransferase-2
VFVQTSSPGAELLGLSVENDLIRFESPKRLSETIREARRLRRYELDVAVLVNLSFRSALICRLAGIPKRIGHVREGRGPLLTDRVPYQGKEFQAISAARLLQPLGLRVARDHPCLFATKQAMESASELVREVTIGVHPCSRDPWKRIPQGVLVETIAGLRDSGHTVALFGGDEEREAGQAIRCAIGNGIIDLIGRTSIPQMVACFSQLRASFGGDTGVMHIAAASGCPTVQVFGSARADKWGHRYPPNRVLQARNHDMSLITANEILDAVMSAMG